MFVMIFVKYYIFFIFVMVFGKCNLFIVVIVFGK